MNIPDISVVVTIFNESETINSLHAEILAACQKLNKTFEIIYVNDGSTDDSLSKLLALRSETVRILKLNKNYGQATAMDAGFKAARGDIVISLDGDGQNNPSDIPLLLTTLEATQADVVAGWRKNRKDLMHIHVLSRIGKMFRSILLSDAIHDTGCTLRAYRVEAIKTLDLGGEMHRYILALLKWKGFKIVEVEVNHRNRQFGTSHYSSTKALRGFFDLVYIWFINKYSQRPLHFFGYLSFASFMGGIASGIQTGYEKIFFDLSVNRNGWFFISIFLLLSSVMFFSFGIIIDFLIRLHLNNSPYEKRYYVKEITS